MPAVLFASILLILSYPNYFLWPCAWFAFIPLFFGLHKEKKPLGALFQFYLFGFLFFFVTVEWLRHVTFLGWIFVALAYADYFGLFGLLAWFLIKQKSDTAFLFLAPSLWATLEWIRTELPIWGFGWNLLAYSQSGNLLIARASALFGAFGVSWLILFGNIALYFLFSSFNVQIKKIKHVILRQSRRISKQRSFALWAQDDSLLQLTNPKRAALGVFALIFVIFVAVVSNIYDSVRSNEDVTRKTQIPVAVIQGNIPQSEKWNPEEREHTLRKYEELTRLMIPAKPELVIWPEAAFPGFLNIDPLQEKVFSVGERFQFPLLVGGLYLSSEREAFNSAYFINRGLFVARYDKMRLVPFGEFVPAKPFFRLFGLDRLADALGVGDFKPGREMNLFSLKNNVRFASLICFEDTFPSLARTAVAKGAQFLTVITNDAWFSLSAAPRQHLQASIFRALENGVPLVRAANTGVSAFVNARGKVMNQVRDQFDNDLFVTGTLSRPVTLSDGRTFYNWIGWQFPIWCLAFLLISLIFQLSRKNILR